MVKQQVREESVEISGAVFWITGLSGAGKSTVANHLRAYFEDASTPVLLLDGDVLRAIFGSVAGHGAAERYQLALTYARLCKEISAQGFDVICTTVSMFHAVHQWNRENIPQYREIYLRVPIEILKRRDPKGLYAGFGRGDIGNVVGLDIPAEPPENANLVIDNFAEVSPQVAASVIWNDCVMPILRERRRELE